MPVAWATRPGVFQSFPSSDLEVSGGRQTQHPGLLPQSHFLVVSKTSDKDRVSRLKKNSNWPHLQVLTGRRLPPHSR